MLLDIPSEEGHLSLVYRHEVNSLIDHVVMESDQFSVLLKDGKILLELYEFQQGCERETLHEMPTSEAVAMAKAILAALGGES